MKTIPLNTWLRGKIVRVDVPRTGYRWQGCLDIEIEGYGIVALAMPGTIAQWLYEGENVLVQFTNEPRSIHGTYIALYDDYMLKRIWRNEEILVWPAWSKEVRLPRYDPVKGRIVYEYRIVAREAITEQDFIEIVGLEQYHYASEEEIVAVWRCPICGKYLESNLQPQCPEHKVPARLQEIRGSLPSSRFLVLELKDRRAYEPRIVAYVRVDTPIPLMHRRKVVNGNIVIEKMIREKVFPKDWFHPTYWPLAYTQRKSIIARYRELIKLYGSRRIARTIVGEEVSREALRIANTASARIARVVVHPDYRGDGLGVLAVKLALEWISERRIPEMKRRKHVVETIAQMARYNPFFEKAGFVYMWETASGRPVLMYPLTDEAKKYIENFIQQDEEAKKHKGRLFTSHYGKVEPISGPIELKDITKTYTSHLDISRLVPELQEVLRAFGVERRVVERYVLRNVNIRIDPGDVVVVVGASGAGKTTLLRLIIGGAIPDKDERYKPTEGEVKIPPNARISYLLPGEKEPEFGSETILEKIAKVVGDVPTAVEILNAVGLSDAVFYRAQFQELSTGQKERAKLAMLLAEKPNVMIIDEFAAHLDALTAQRVARKLREIVSRAGITLIVSTNRSEIIKALSPTKIIYVGYGTAFAIRYEESEYYFS